MSVKSLRDSSEGRIVVKNPAVLLPQQAGVTDLPKSPALRGVAVNKSELSEVDGQAGSDSASAVEAIDLSALSASSSVYQFEPLQLAQAGTTVGTAGGTAGAAAESGGLIAGMSATTVAAVAAVGVVGVAAASSSSSSGTPQNLPPTFAAASITAPGAAGGAPITGSVKATDPEGGAVSYTIKTQGTKGSATVDASTGAFKYTLTDAIKASGSDSFVVTAKDPSGQAVDQTVNVTLVNGAPAITTATTTASVTGLEDAASITGAVKATDPESGAIVYSIKTQGAIGATTLDASTGSFSYKPNANANGSDKFVVSATDPSGLVTDQTVNVTVSAVNDAPVFAATTVSLTGTEDVVVTGTAVATDIDSTGLTYSIKGTGAANGTAVVDSKTGAYTYTPKADYNGADSFVVVASDGSLTAEQAVNVTLAAVNDAPRSTALSTTAFSVASGEAASFVIDAVDVDSPISSLKATIGTSPANGAITFGSSGNFYTPKAGFTGTDSFVVSLSDGAASSSYTVAVKVVPNLAPVFAAPTTVTLQGTEDVLVTGVAKATDPEGSAVVYSVAAVAKNGSVALDSVTGAYTYTPNLDYNGADSFVVSAKDPVGNITTTNLTVNLNLAAVNDAPRFAKTSVAVSGTEDTALTGSVSATDPEGSAVSYSIKAGGSTSGAVVIDKATGAYTYTPKLDVNGSDSFVVLASDGTASSEQTVNVTLAAVNDAPVITSAATVTVNEKVPVSTVVYTATATDVDNASLTYSLSGADATAFKINTGNGQVTFGVSPDFATKSAYTFNVVASDGLLSATKSVSLSVNSLATTVSLDVDSDGNLNTLFPINLGTGAFRLTDSPTDANAVTVTGLTSDDFFSFGGVATDYSYTYTNSSKTLSISSNIAGTFSSINIAGVTIGTLVTDEASAETGLAVALGVSGTADFFRFASSSTGGGTTLDPLTSLDYDTDSSLATVYKFDANAAGTATVAYTDSSKIGSNASISNFGLVSPGVGDTITVDTSTSAWSFSSSNKSATTVDIDISYNNAGTISLIKLLGAAPATAGLVNSEATAELALGYDFFKSSETVNANVALDLASGDLTLRTLDAGNGANQYIEDGSKANQVRITNFGGGDSITVINLGNPAYTSTASGYFSSSGKDILFSNNVNGTASVITLVNAVTIPGLVYDEVTAERAAGFDFISFRFA